MGQFCDKVFTLFLMIDLVFSSLGDSLFLQNQYLVLDLISASLRRRREQAGENKHEFGRIWVCIFVGFVTPITVIT